MQIFFGSSGKLEMKAVAVGVGDKDKPPGLFLGDKPDQNRSDGRWMYPFEIPRFTKDLTQGVHRFEDRSMPAR